MNALYAQPPGELFEVATRVPTPALLYDFGGIRHVARAIQEDAAAIAGGRLNLALKACHTLPVLRLFAELGLGCDVASVGELRLAQQAGFREISCTGPAFSVDDFRAFVGAGIVPDVDSVSQMETFGAHFPRSRVGLRLRIPLPKALESDATFGADSRFGMLFTRPDVMQTVERFELHPTRLHVHTGQTTPEALVFKADYLLSIAEFLPEVELVDLGGGLFHLYPDISRARAAYRAVAERVKNWSLRTGRRMNIRFEPGGALLAPCGYLVAEVRAVEDHPHFGRRVVTVDASAWNLAPWHKPQVFVLPDRGELDEPGLIAGNTLYEGDFFARDVLGRQHPLAFAPCRTGDRLLITAFGAYTMTNSRRFNRIPPPVELALDGARLIDLAGRIEDPS